MSAPMRDGGEAGWASDWKVVIFVLESDIISCVCNLGIFSAKSSDIDALTDESKELF